MAHSIREPGTDGQSNIWEIIINTLAVVYAMGRKEIHIGSEVDEGMVFLTDQHCLGFCCWCGKNCFCYNGKMDDGLMVGLWWVAFLWVLYITCMK